LPSGWSTSIGGNNVTVTHTVGTRVRKVNYLGFNSAGSTYRLRFPTAASQMTIPDSSGPSTTQFIVNVSSSITGADNSGFCLVDSYF
jgi:hypothetical protein